MAKKVNIKTLLRTNDAFLTTSERFFNYYLSHTRRIWIIVGVAAAVAIAVLAFKNYHESRLASGVEAFNRAVAAPDPGLAQAALEDVIGRYPGTPAARQASFALVANHLDQGRVDEALPLLEALSGTLSPAEESLKPLVRSTLAGLYEEKGRLDEALALYREVLALAGSVPVTEASLTFQIELLNSVGRVAQALGRPDEAIQAYQALLAISPNTYRSFGASVRLAKLVAQAKAAAPPTEAPGAAPAAAPAAGTAAPASGPPEAADSSPAAPPAAAPDAAGTPEAAAVPDSAAAPASGASGEASAGPPSGASSDAAPDAASEAAPEASPEAAATDGTPEAAEAPAAD